MPTLVDQVAAARERLQHLIAHPEEYPLGVSQRLADEASRTLRELESMEGDTRFMPHTRRALETGQVPLFTHDIILELDDHIGRLLRAKPYVAHHRRRRRDGFASNPNLDTLRKIWIL